MCVECLEERYSKTVDSNFVSWGDNRFFFNLSVLSINSYLVFLSVIFKLEMWIFFFFPRFIEM